MLPNYDKEAAIKEGQAFGLVEHSDFGASGNIGALMIRIRFPLKGSLKGSIRSGRDLL